MRYNFRILLKFLKKFKKGVDTVSTLQYSVDIRQLIINKLNY